jgi:gas vesicle protein
MKYSFLVVYQGGGEGCDYTIGCNVKVSIVEIEYSGLIDKEVYTTIYNILARNLHADHSGQEYFDKCGEPLRNYMCETSESDEETDHKFRKVHAYLIEDSKDISKNLCALIKQDQNNLKVKTARETENAERELYQKLKNKYGSKHEPADTK